MTARIRTAATVVRAWIINPVTMAAAVLIAGAMGVWLIADPPRSDVAGPPAEIGTAKVGGYCSRVVTAADGAVWALAPGAADGALRRVDPSSVNRTECQPRTPTGEHNQGPVDTGRWTPGG